MASRKLKVEIVGDASSLHRAFGQAADSGNRFGSVLQGVGKAAAFAVGGAALGGVAVTLKAGISEFKDATRVAAQTAAVLKSTGGAANVSAKQVDALATSIQGYSGIDDEAVKSGENLLLTFTNIRNEVGKGNDIFTQSTKAIVDMSVALGQDMKSSAIQVGKALNDPIKGVTALRRVGVSFTQAQQDQIKALVKAGKTIDAQKLILRELNKEFGGSAKAAGDTLPGQLNKLRETFKNLAGDLIGKAVPALTSFTGFVAEKGIPKLEEFFGLLTDKAGPAIEGIGKAFTAAIPAVQGVLQPLINTVADRMVPIFASLEKVGTEAMTKISAIIRANGPELQRIFGNLGQVVANIAKVALPILRFAFAEVLPAALKILIPLLVALTTVLAKASNVIRVIARAIQAVLLPVLRVAIKAVEGFAAALGKLPEIAKTVGRALGGLGKLIASAFTAAFDFVVKKAIQAALAIVEPFSHIPKKLGGGVFQDLKASLKRSLDGMAADSRTTATQVNAALGSIKDRTVTLGVNVAVGNRPDPRLEGGTGNAAVAQTAAKSITDALTGTVSFFHQAINDATKKTKKAIAAAKTHATVQRKAFDTLMESLSLKVDQAAATRGFADDLRRNSELQAAIRKQIAVEGKTTELAGDLFQAQQARAQILADQAQAATDARTKAAAKIQANQFKALGFTATGDTRTPGVANLKRQLAQLTDRLGSDATPKIRGQLVRIGRVLAGGFGKVTLDTRQKILELFEKIRSTFEQGSASLQHTATRAINRNAILRGLGLDNQTEGIIKRRLQGFNTAGRALAPAAGTFGAFGIPFSAHGQPINVTVVTQLDGQKVGQSVHKFNQARSRSNPKQKRGPLAGI